jgi:hypothetical protein
MVSGLTTVTLLLAAGINSVFSIRIPTHAQPAPCVSVDEFCQVMRHASNTTRESFMAKVEEYCNSTLTHRNGVLSSEFERVRSSSLLKRNNHESVRAKKRLVKRRIYDTIQLKQVESGTSLAVSPIVKNCTWAEGALAYNVFVVDRDKVVLSGARDSPPGTLQFDSLTKFWDIWSGYSNGMIKLTNRDRDDESCLDGSGTKVYMHRCIYDNPHQYWKVIRHDHSTYSFRHLQTGKCLDGYSKWLTNDVFLRDCDTKDSSQRWRAYNPKGNPTYIEY